MTATTDNKRLTHDDIRRACGAAGSAKEMTCPICAHSHLQLFGRDDFDCKNGCPNEMVAAEIRRHLDTGEPIVTGTHKPKKLKPSQLETWQGFALSEYCKLKGLDARVLKYLFDAREVSYRGKVVIGWPYYDDAGKVLATKLRLSADSHDTLFNPADPHVPYGLNNPHLQNLVAGTYDLFITEGESDCQTLACYSYLSIGISGSQGWLPEYADLPVIERARRVFVCEDQDADGKTFVAKVLRTLPQAFVLRPEGVKDINELHMKYIGFDAAGKHSGIGSRACGPAGSSHKPGAGARTTDLARTRGRSASAQGCQPSEMGRAVGVRVGRTLCPCRHSRGSSAHFCGVYCRNF
jgi:hypothetical protein